MRLRLQASLCSTLIACCSASPVLAQISEPGEPPSMNVVTDSGNGAGNAIVLDNDGPGGSVTILRNVRNGVGNRLTVRQNGRRMVYLTDDNVTPRRHYDWRNWTNAAPFAVKSRKLDSVPDEVYPFSGRVAEKSAAAERRRAMIRDAIPDRVKKLMMDLFGDTD